MKIFEVIKNRDHQGLTFFVNTNSKEINAVNKDGNTPIVEAALLGDNLAVEMLARCEICDLSDITKYYTNDLKMYSYLLSCGARANDPLDGKLIPFTSEDILQKSLDKTYNKYVSSNPSAKEVLKNIYNVLSDNMYKFFFKIHSEYTDKQLVLLAEENNLLSKVVNIGNANDVDHNELFHLDNTFMGND
jgi:hypothetical protein